MESSFLDRFLIKFSKPNNNLVSNVVTYILTTGVTVTVFDSVIRTGKLMHIHIGITVAAELPIYSAIIGFSDLPNYFFGNQLISSDKGRFFLNDTKLYTGETLAAGDYYISGVALLQ